ncbi:hypothetical protein [Nemorincola caseinilytica]
MKKFILICGLGIIIQAHALAQTSYTAAQVAASKTEFISKAHELETLLEGGSQEAIVAKWREMQGMVKIFFLAYEQQLKEAKQANDASGISRAKTKISDQGSLLNTVMLLSADMKGNAADLNAAISAFAAGL